MSHARSVVLSGLCALVLFGPPAPSLAQEEERVFVDAGDLIRAYAERRGLTYVIDPGISGIGISLDGQSLEAIQGLEPADLRRLLDFHDVVLRQSGRLLEVHSRRSLASRVGPPWRVLSAGQEAQPNELITKVFQIEHGDANAIFATVRGLLTRDPNRIGNILYVAGPERIVLVDLVEKVDYYANLIAALDHPPAAGSRQTLRISVALLDAAAWNKVRDLPAAQLADRVAGMDEALVDEGRLDLSGDRPRFSSDGESQAADGARSELSVRFGPRQARNGGQGAQAEQTPAETGYELEVLWSRRGQDGFSNRRLRAELPARLGEQPWIQALRIGHPAPSYLVVVLDPRARQ